ncbi:E2-like enzyme [Steccherinum ochraceum]|uniref:Autophagy-related protein 3 n=1 Tax=Steccherinum ochraceum TaxID=92696 RepID=A0A4R0RIQ4_9APHY|nr:E2-like enzyme [Steccherinum ochraceum]
MHAIQQQYWAVRDYLSPVLKESKFKEHGRITPAWLISGLPAEEFVAAGDFLAYKFAMWSWEKGDASKVRDYLPADKQYLITRGVPCLRRATSLAYTDEDEDRERLLSFGDLSSTGNEADEWVETHAGRSGHQDSETVGEIDDIPDVDDHHGGVSQAMSGLSIGGGAGKAAADDIPDIDDIPDMEEEGLEDGDDEATAAPKAGTTSDVIESSQIEVASGNLLQVRTYDVMITYDKYYQTPRIWLVGYDEKNRTPLTPPQIFQDVSADHAFKTVTIEPFPHSATLQAASVHPCKHASVMKKVIERMNQNIVVQEPKSSAGAGKEKDKQKKWLFQKSSKNGKEDKAAAAAAAAAEEDENDGMKVDFYLVVFLKFIASIVPTIEVDATTSF